MQKSGILHIIDSHCAGPLAQLVVDFVQKFNERGLCAQLVYLKQPGAGDLKIADKKIALHIIEKQKGLDIKLIFHLAQIIRKEKINICHSHDLESVIYSSLAAKLSGISSVHTQHIRAYKKIPNFIFALNKYIIPVSEDIKKNLLQCQRINEQKIQIIYNGIDLASIDRHLDNHRRLKMRMDLGIGKDTFLLGNIGHLTAQEDQITIIKALRKLIQRDTDAQLLIAGNGPQKEILEAFISKYHLKNRVKFLDPQRVERGEILNMLDVYILANFSEGRPFSLLEAMAAGKPVIATTVGSNAEVVEEKKTGYMVPCGFPERIHSALMRILAIDTLASEIGQAGRKKIEEGFTLDRMALFYEQVYRQI